MRLEESMRAGALVSSGASLAASREEWGPGYRYWRYFLALLAQRGPEGTTSLVRMASHLMILLVAVVVLWMSHVELPGWDIAEIGSENTDGESESFFPAQAARRTANAGTLVRSAVPLTLVHERPLTAITTYTVQTGDTLYAIADRYQLNAETLIWANDIEDNPDLLRLDQQITIPPVNGVVHTVVEGDTVESIAQKYKAAAADVLAFEGNSIDPKNPALVVGSKIMVPGGSKPMPVRPVQQDYVAQARAPVNAPIGSTRFTWPTYGTITTAFRPYHQAIDIAVSYGTPIKASDAGYVASVIYSGVGYGNHVIIDHGNGFQTLYAHMSKIYVSAGETVGQGAVIGAVGSTGHSTGPHLHFEIRQGGVLRNPFSYLP